MKCLGIVALLALSTPLYAQDSLTLPTENGRKAADIATWVTDGVTIGIDVARAWQCADRKKCLLSIGFKNGVGYGITELLKLAVQEKRPCYPACGNSNPMDSFPSGHTMFAVNALDICGGRQLGIQIPLAVGTGAGRIMAGKHYWWDVLAGAGVGFATNAIFKPC